ncbi:MAG: DegV family protein [Acidimicrobiales bacterium]
MIALVTDSNAQLPPELARRHRVEVVPLTVTVDGDALLEGVDIDADAFYSRFATVRPRVSTAQPSPGRFAAAYAAVAERGAVVALSIHIGSAVSGTLNSARVAARGSAVPIRLVDTGTASFGVACCVWEAAEALVGGASVEEAAVVAEEVGAAVGNVFVVGGLDLARAGGRLAPGAEVGAGVVAVLSMVGREMKVVGEAADVEGAVEAMARHVLASGSSLRVGVGMADAATGPLARALEDRLRRAPEVREVVRYRIGPSVGAHTGPGTVGAYFYPPPTSRARSRLTPAAPRGTRTPPARGRRDRRGGG